MHCLWTVLSFLSSLILLHTKWRFVNINWNLSYCLPKWVWKEKTWCRYMYDENILYSLFLRLQTPSLSLMVEVLSNLFIGLLSPQSQFTTHPFTWSHTLIIIVISSRVWIILIKYIWLNYSIFVSVCICVLYENQESKEVRCISWKFLYSWRKFQKAPKNIYNTLTATIIKITWTN